jgi:uncharacterized RDD family membrane protein YckC
LTYSEISSRPVNIKHLCILTLILTLHLSLKVLASDSIQVIRLSAILVSNESLAKELAERISHGEDFAKLASNYSEYPNAPPDGDLGFIALADVTEPMKSWTMSLQVGGTSNVISTDNGYLILKKTDYLISKKENTHVNTVNSQPPLTIVPMLVTLGLLSLLVIATVKVKRKKGYGGFRVLLGVLMILCAAVGTFGSLSEAIKVGFAPGHLTAPIFAIVLLVGGIRLLLKPQPAPIIEGVVYADFGPRLLSLLIDGAITMGIIVAAQYFLSTFSVSFFTIANIGTSSLISIAAIFFLWKFGATPGKLIVGIYVVKLDITKVTLREAILRCSVDIVFMILYIVAFLQLLKVMDFSTFSGMAYGPRGVYMLGFFPKWYEYSQLASYIWLSSEVIVLLFNKKKRALHDYIAGTVVVRKHTLRQGVENNAVE